MLVRALSDISRHFDMVTVAEFVETDSEAEMVAKLGVDCLQGYLIGEPTAQPRAPFTTTGFDQKIAS